MLYRNPLGDERSNDELPATGLSPEYYRYDAWKFSHPLTRVFREELPPTLDLRPPRSYRANCARNWLTSAPASGQSPEAPGRAPYR